MTILIMSAWIMWACLSMNPNFDRAHAAFDAADDDVDEYEPADPADDDDRRRDEALDARWD